MPLVIGQTRAKFDNLPFASLDALVVELNPTSDLEGHDLLAFQVVDGKEHLLRLAFGSECGKNGKVGGKSIGKEVSSWDAGNTPIADGVSNIGCGDSICHALPVLTEPIGSLDAPREGFEVQRLDEVGRTCRKSSSRKSRTTKNTSDRTGRAYGTVRVRLRMG
jgi:hypothetical protein